MEKKLVKLYEPFTFGSIKAKNRFLMAPMTRSRATEPGLVPNALMAEYYAQRASAGLIVTEATQISLQSQGYARTPGIYTDEQEKGWAQVTKAVHDAGTEIILQLWHVGRVSSAKVNGLQPLAPSAIPAKDTNSYIFDGAPNGDATFIPVDTPREMTQADIDTTIADFANAAKRAVRAGFDGIEIHGANGYLIDQFLRSNSNKRTDAYGGSPQNRVRFLVEVTKAVIEAIGKEKTGVRLSPYIRFKDMDDPEILDTIILAAAELDKLGVAFIHFCESDWEDAPVIPEDFRLKFRKTYKGAIIATGSKTPEEGEDLVEKNLVDLVGFGRKFINNPDYPERVRNNYPLEEKIQTHKLFGGGEAEGYSDYPAYK